MHIASSTVFSALLLASNVLAQRFTTTYTWAQGDTVVISTGTDALGDATTRVISTITGAAGITTALTATTALTTTAADDDDDTPTTTKTSTTKTATTTQRVVGNTPTTTGKPMRTTTYWLDPGDGVYTDYTWTAPTTALPTVATANVAEGTIQDYQAYQSAINSVVLQSAEAAVANASTGGASRRQAMGVEGAVGGWMTMVLGVIGAGVGLLIL
ncbi:uncharacterized protein IL334_002843 [Kwoniella shivajii]|uniref:Uncharacterized protein n=1 Tax=Kwoniella shivajii TaxID=564305 RepID=A0ABZ1D007_9TREE|nr:hypothetical protein IL334_002843 [Kwoniella shivajii]